MKYDNLLELRGQPAGYQKAFLEILGLFLLIGIWQAVSLYIGRTGILPSPLIPIKVAAGDQYGSVLTSIPELWMQDLLLKNIFYSLYLNAMGYLIAISVALPLGFMIGLSPVANGLFSRPVDAVRFLPLTALTGIFIAWFGIYSNMKILFLAFGIFVYLVPVVAQRIWEVEDVYIQTAQTLGASKWQQIFKVFMPAAFSKLSDDIRILTAISWTYIIVAELINNEGGIGALAYRSARQGRLDKSFMLLFIIILLGIGQDRLFAFIDKKMFKHKYVKIEQRKTS